MKNRKSFRPDPPTELPKVTMIPEPPSTPPQVDGGMVWNIPQIGVLAPPHYEYKSILLARDADLNQFGAEGWELVSTVVQAADRVMFYFRRIKS
jgi:hypothetical protein